MPVAGQEPTADVDDEETRGAGVHSVYLEHDHHHGHHHDWQREPQLLIGKSRLAGSNDDPNPNLCTVRAALLADAALAPYLPDQWVFVKGRAPLGVKAEAKWRLSGTAPAYRVHPPHDVTKGSPEAVRGSGAYVRHRVHGGVCGTPHTYHPLCAVPVIRAACGSCDSHQRRSAGAPCQGRPRSCGGWRRYESA
jgi:hypothetical protein